LFSPSSPLLLQQAIRRLSADDKITSARQEIPILVSAFLRIACQLDKTSMVSKFTFKLSAAAR
jgi:hypothetical protein